MSLTTIHRCANPSAACSNWRDSGYAPLAIQKDFLNEMATHRVRLVVLDIWMERMTGMELLAHLCARSPETRVIFITGHEDRAAEATVMRAGAAGFFIKPLDNEKFIAAVRDALKQA